MLLWTFRYKCLCGQDLFFKCFLMSVVLKQGWLCPLASDIKWTDAREAAKHPTMGRAATQQRILPLKMSVVHRLRILCPRWLRSDVQRGGLGSTEDPHSPFLQLNHIWTISKTSSKKEDQHSFRMVRGLLFIWEVLNLGSGALGNLGASRSCL